MHIIQIEKMADSSLFDIEAIFNRLLLLLEAIQDDIGVFILQGAASGEPSWLPYFCFVFTIEKYLSNSNY